MKPAQRIETDTWLIIAFLLPTLAFLIFLIWLPFIQGIWMSFHNWPLIGETKWEGLENYRDFLAADYFWVVIKSTIFYSFSTALQLAMALVAALALNQKFIPLKQVWRGIMLMPYAMPPVVTGAIWLYMLDPNMGMVMHYFITIGQIMYI